MPTKKPVGRPPKVVRGQKKPIGTTVHAATSSQGPLGQQPQPRPKLQPCSVGASTASSASGGSTAENTTLDTESNGCNANSEAEWVVGQALMAMMHGHGAEEREPVEDILNQAWEELQASAGEEFPEDAAPAQGTVLEGIDEDDEDDETVEEEPGRWDIPFHVPTGPKTVDTIKLCSLTSWSSFQEEVAGQMDIATKHLMLSYKLTMETKDAPSRVLNSASHWLELKEQATIEYKAMTTGQSTKGHPKKYKPVEVLLIDQHLKEKGETQGKGKGKGKNDSGGAKRRRDNRGTDEESENDEGSRHSNWVLNLQNKYACEAHAKQFCVVGAGGVHMKLTTPDLSLWALLLDKGKADRNMEVMPDTNTVMLQAQRKVRGRSGPFPLPAVAPPQPALGAPGTPMQQGYIPPYPYPGLGYYLYPPPYYGTPARSHPYGRGPHTPVFRDTYPSSEPEDAEDPSLFPHIDDWLQSLDDGPLGVDGLNVSQYATPLLAQGYICISQLVDTVTVTDLLRHCPGLLEGTAQLILRHAHKAIEKVQRQQQKHTRHHKKRRYY
ncbi:hypothetical protein K439DRAFT_1611494 [Ramaria rubella]|nr:hypothetical protein K439DRAFT_1611494 [Ramaria rubella]